MLQTLRDVAGLPTSLTPLREAALVMIDCRNTYRERVMKLSGVRDLFAVVVRTANELEG
jgi:hypothetical protein